MEKRKTEMLRQLLQQDDFKSAIVFTRTKRRARQLAEKLDRDGHRAVALQGNMSQNQRDRAMKGFRQNNFDILVATDIAARGIDVAPNLSCHQPGYSEHAGGLHPQNWKNRSIGARREGVHLHH